jgi:hypothetical protein
MEGHDARTQLAGQNYLRTPAMGRHRLDRFCPTGHEAAREIVVCFPRYRDDGNRSSLLQSKLAIRTFFLFPFFLLFVFAVVAVAIAHGVASSIALPYILHVAVIVALSVSIFILLLHWPGRRWRPRSERLAHKPTVEDEPIAMIMRSPALRRAVTRGRGAP